jgi:hypothetical protein
MKRNFFVVGVLTMLLAFTLLAGCEQNPDTDPPYKPTYELEGGGTLTITGGEGATAPKTGDTFELVIGGKKTTGTIEVDANGTITFIPKNGGDSFTAKPGSGNAIAIEGGNITADDGATVTVPDEEVVPTAPSGGDDEGGVTAPSGGDLEKVFEGTLSSYNVTEAVSASTLIENFSQEFAGQSVSWEEFVAAGCELYVNNKKVTSGSEMIQPSATVRVMAPAGGDDGLEKTPGTIQGTWKKDNITLTIREANLTISGANWSGINGTFAITRIRDYGDDDIFIVFGPSEDPFGLVLKRVGANLIIPSDSGPNELHGTWTAVSSAPGGGGETGVPSATMIEDTGTTVNGCAYSEKEIHNDSDGNKSTHYLLSIPYSEALQHVTATLGSPDGDQGSLFWDSALSAGDTWVILEYNEYVFSEGGASKTNQMRLVAKSGTISGKRWNRQRP